MRQLRFKGGPWDGETREARDVHFSDGRVIVRQSWVPPLDFAAIARGDLTPDVGEYKMIQTEYAEWSDGTWRVRAIVDGIVGRREYDVPPDIARD